MEDNQFIWNSGKRYAVCVICGCLIVAIAGAEIVSARCHKESCRELDVHHHPVEFPAANNFHPHTFSVTTATATTLQFFS